MLVTGANGFTGAEVVNCLIARGVQVRGWVRETSDLTRLEGLPITLFKGTLGKNTQSAEEMLANALEEVDWVIHTAAYVDLGIVNEKAMHEANVHGTHALLEACVKAGVKRFVHCSTIGVFGDTSGEVADET